MITVRLSKELLCSSPSSHQRCKQLRKQNCWLFNESHENGITSHLLTRKCFVHTSNSSKGLPRLYTSFFLPLSEGKMVKNNARHPISKTAVLPMVTSMKFVGGGWPMESALMIIPNWNVNDSMLWCERTSLRFTVKRSRSLYQKNSTRLGNKGILCFVKGGWYASNNMVFSNEDFF